MKEATDPVQIPWGRQTPDGQVLLSMPWEIFVLGLAVLSIINMALGFLVVFFERNPDIEQVISFVDALLIIVFLIDFLRRLNLAADDRAYLLAGRGWLDLISVVPFLRIARILRIVRVYGLVGRMGGPTAAMRVFFKDRASGGLFVVLLLAIVVLEFGSLAILWAEERDPEANITTAGDALWYSIVTMSTVGYGDQFPVTEVGRLTGALIIVIGVGVFGTLTGFLANAFLAPGRSETGKEAEPETAPAAPDPPA